MLKQSVKRILQKTGAYPFARSLYRKLDNSSKSVALGELALYRPFVGEGDLVFDIGVNVGQKSEIFLSLGARVIGLEPNPQCKSALDFAFGNNPRFTLVQKAAI